MTTLPMHLVARDGTPILLRLGTPADREALVAGFARLSPESRTSRFFTGMPKLSPLFLDRLLDVEPDRHVAVAAIDLSRPPEDGDSDRGYGIGVARYFVSADDPTRAEMAVAVIDEYHHRGVGRLLLDALIGEATKNGITTFTATVLSSNTRMLRMLMAMGASPHWDPDDYSIVELELPVGPDADDHSMVHAVFGRVAGGSASTADASA